MHRTCENQFTLAAILMSTAGFASLAATADEPITDSQTAKSVLPQLIERIVTDPYRAYADVRGPDDCNSEALYLATKEVLANYAASPAENAGALRQYVLSDETQCNCTAALIGKDFDILLHDVGSDISKVPCR
jgi:hypothetical protein